MYILSVKITLKFYINTFCWLPYFFTKKNPKTEKSTGFSCIKCFKEIGKLISRKNHSRYVMIGVVLLWSGGGHLIIIEVYPRLHHNTSLLYFEKSSWNINFTEKITTFIIIFCECSKMIDWSWSTSTNPCFVRSF